MTDYKGHDYTELFPILGVECNDDDPDTDADVFREGLVRLQQRCSERENVLGEILHIKMYLQSMIECGIDYFGPVWGGLIAVEDDYTFLQACVALSDYMWT